MATETQTLTQTSDPRRRESPVTACTFAMSGTYGHECGRPATQVAVSKCLNTREASYFPVAKYDNETYFAGRCDECARIKGGENAGVVRFEKLAGHVNRWGY